MIQSRQMIMIITMYIILDGIRIWWLKIRSLHPLIEQFYPMPFAMLMQHKETSLTSHIFKNLKPIQIRIVLKAIPKQLWYDRKFTRTRTVYQRTTTPPNRQIILRSTDQSKFGHNDIN